MMSDELREKIKYCYGVDCNGQCSDCILVPWVHGNEVIDCVLEDLYE